ncbi:hypothetical protein ACIGXM_05800 [Kitasatospora sp. NPDC052896]|uniref:hypothetical protein n=1 Tax=Kitasatospora sp. NPDC052896 TaxID=3364061 RepID=UPI0037CADEFD
MIAMDQLVRAVYADLDTDIITSISQVDLAQLHAHRPSLAWEDAVKTLVNNRLPDTPRLTALAYQAVADQLAADRQ